MQRLNIFNQIHKGLRALLYDTALSLQQTDFTSETESADAFNRIREVVMLFDEHAHKEDHFVFPSIADFEPAVIDIFSREHKKDLALSENLVQAIEAFGPVTDEAARIIAGIRLNTSFVAFMVFNLEHMAKEEDILNKILWQYYSDEDILKIQRKVLSATKPLHAEFYNKWMIRGINNTEAAHWLKSVERSAPDIVFQTLFDKAEKELPRSRFRKVVEHLTGGLMLA